MGSGRLEEVPLYLDLIEVGVPGLGDPLISTGSYGIEAGGGRCQSLPREGVQDLSIPPLDEGVQGLSFPPLEDGVHGRPPLRDTTEGEYVTYPPAPLLEEVGETGAAS